MGKLAKKIAYLKESIAMLKENISSLTETSYDGWSLRDVVDDLTYVNVYKSPFDYLPAGVYDTPFGSLTVPNDSHIYVCLKENLNHAIGVSPPSRDGVYYDFSYGRSTLYFTKKYSGGGYTVENFRLVNPKCVIFPEYVDWLASETITITNVVALFGGLYLPRKIGGITSDWITVYGIKENVDGDPVLSSLNVMTPWDITVKCPVDTEMFAIYLQVISMTADTMIGIFNNLKDVSSETQTYRIQVGDTNLARLTNAQKAIATNKGWVLS